MEKDLLDKSPSAWSGLKFIILWEEGSLESSLSIGDVYTEKLRECVSLNRHFLGHHFSPTGSKQLAIKLTPNNFSATILLTELILAC